jgi:hypothetical protein
MNAETAGAATAAIAAIRPTYAPYCQLVRPGRDAKEMITREQVHGGHAGQRELARPG